MTNKRRQFLWDMFVTALEGGIGYWSSCNVYHIWRIPTQPSEGPDLRGFHATIEDIEDANKVYRIDAEVIQRGLRAIADGRVNVNSDIRAAVLLASRTNGDDGDYDAGVADCVVQAGLFGEVVYG